MSTHSHSVISLLGLLLVVALGCGEAHGYDVLCRDGNTAFEAYLSGVTVDVGPPTRGGLAGRSCRALLSWDDQEIVVARDVAELDLDLFAADLGLGYPVAAFQIKKSAAACCMTYKIYSLQNPPQLLRALRGGGYFSAADTNLDGQVEIWTDDAATVDGFEGLTLAQIQFPPTCVLRFNHDRLVDVSSEFQPYFDREIAELRARLQPGQVERFKRTDGRLAASTLSAADQLPLLTVKTEILELVWAYLYSNREKKAWQMLAEMWPAADVARIRAAILLMRARGMRAQVDEVSTALPPLETDIQHATIYDSTSKPAQPIMVRLYQSAGLGKRRRKLRVDLIIDGAGKVWSVKVSGKNQAAFDAVKRSTSNWKFIPALVEHHPVASRLRMNIALEQ